MYEIDRKEPILLPNDDCIKLAKILTEYIGQDFLPQTRKIFKESNIIEVNGFLKMCADVAGKEVVDRNSDISNINREVLAKKVINYLDGYSKNIKQWAKEQPILVLFAINSFFEFEQQFRVLKNSIEKNKSIILKKEINKQEEEKCLNDYNYPLDIISKKTQVISDEIFNKSFIRKYIKEDDWIGIRYNISENCKKEYENICQMRTYENTGYYDENVIYSIDDLDIREDAYYKDVLKSFGYRKTKDNYDKFYTEFIDNDDNKLIETNIILKHFSLEICDYLKDVLSNAINDRVFRDLVESKKYSINVCSEKATGFKKLLYSSECNPRQLCFLIDNEEEIGINLMYKIFNQTHSKQVEELIDVLIKLKKVNFDVGENIRVSELKRKIDYLCYNLFMTNNERKTIDENYAAIGTYMQYVPSAYQRLYKFTSNLI